jgi:hypothetical protein
MNLRTILKVISCSLLAVSELHAVGEDRDKPSTLSAVGSSKPFWISAAAASTPTGEVNYEVFPPGLQEAIRSQVKLDVHVAGTSISTVPPNSIVAPCGTFTLAFTGAPNKAMASWRDAVDNADAIIEGTVTLGFRCRARNPSRHWSAR